MKIFNPSNDELITELVDTPLSTIEEIVNSARISQRSWCRRSLSERLSVVKKFSQLLTENSERLARITSSEVGKSIAEAMGEISGAHYRIQYFLDHAEQILKKEKVHIDGATEEFLDFEALGVIANISAWNYPYLVGVNVFIPALIAGNAVMYKPSEFASMTGVELGKIFHQAGLPENLFQVIIGGKEAGEKLLEIPLDGYFFTGSYQTGQYIATKVAPKLVPIGLELGGKDPLYITDDLVSIQKAASDAVEGAFYNNGQSCCAVERIYVHETVYEKFVHAFVNKVKELQISPLTRKEQLNTLTQQVVDAENKGAKPLCGGKRRECAGNYFEPTVLTNVNHDMLIMREESFGPIIGLQKVNGDKQAIELMNDTAYGLSAGVFCQDQARSQSIMQELNAGNVYQNCCDRVSPYLPWAGRGNSGLGATLSYLGLLSFVQTKGYHHRTL